MSVRCTILEVPSSPTQRPTPTPTTKQGCAHRGEAGGLRDNVLFIHVDVRQIDRSRGEGVDHLLGHAVDHHNPVVLLQCDDQEVVLVDRDELGLGVGAIDEAVKAGELHLGRRHRGHLDDLHVAGGHLGRLAVPQVFVALVFDGDGEVLPVGRDGNGVGLATEVDLARDRPGRDADLDELARRVDKVWAGVDARVSIATTNSHGGGLAAHGDSAKRPWRTRIRNVDEPDHLRVQWEGVGVVVPSAWSHSAIRGIRLARAEQPAGGIGRARAWLDEANERTS